MTLSSLIRNECANHKEIPMQRIKRQSQEGLAYTRKLAENLGKRDGLKSALGVKKMVVFPVLHIKEGPPYKENPYFHIVC